MKKFLSCFLALVMLISIPAFSASADAYDEQRVVMGADLSSSQRDSVYNYFGIDEGDITELKVTNDEEREYLEGKVSEDKIGTRSISCIYISLEDEDKGLDVKTHNINWCTEDMYVNALVTVGITDADVIVAAPFKVSGTAALTGIYKAYEDITGEKLDDKAKDVGTEELVITGELAEDIGSEEAAALVNELKKMINQLKDMTDDEVRNQITIIANQYNIQLNSDQIDRLLDLIRQMQTLDLDKLQQSLSTLGDKLLESTGSSSWEDFWQKVVDIFLSIGEFFSDLFSGN